MKRNAASGLFPKPSCSHLSVSVNNEFCRRQLFQTHRPEGVELGCADADLCPKPKLKAVAEARGGVDKDCRGIDLTEESLRPFVALGDDRFGVEGAVLFDVGNRLV